MLRRIFEIIEYYRIHLAIGFFVLTYSLSEYLGAQNSLLSSVIVSSTVAAAYLLNRESDVEEDLSNTVFSRADAERAGLYGKILLVMSIGLGLLSGMLSLAVVLLFYATLIGYQTSILSVGKYERLKEIPLVKNLVPAVALPGLLIGTVVSISEPHLLSASVLFGFLFLRVLTGSIMPDIGDVEGDQDAGVDTLPVLFDISKVKIILLVGNLLALLPVIYGAQIGRVSGLLMPATVITVLTLPVAYAVSEESADKATFIHEMLDMYVFPGLIILGGYLPWL